MSSLRYWSMIIILYQTIICIILSWAVLECKLSPSSKELHELTLMKLLYLYDPQVCGRLYFYNYTTSLHNRIHASIIWPVTNEVAADFRKKIQVWLSLHIIWLTLGLVNSSQGYRPFGFYATLLPFTLAGAALLIVDIVYAVLFFIDAGSTATENILCEYYKMPFILPAAILYFINAYRGNVQIINTDPHLTPGDEEDTTWIPVLLAYVSVRGIVQWVVNFWIIKDNYFEGLDYYCRLQQPNLKHKLHKKGSEYLYA